MPKVSKIQTNFNAGEVSQNVQGRVDSERYDTGMSTLFNYLPILQGPIVRRPGTKYVANVKDSTKPPVLAPFEVSLTQSYILEFGNQYVRFFTQDGQCVTVSSSVVGTGSLYDPIYWPSSVSNAYPIGTFYTTRDSNYGGIAGEVLTTSSVVAGLPLELQTPYNYQDVQLLRWTQQNDTLYIFHPYYRPMKIQRKGPSYWDIKPVFFRDGPYLPFNSHDTIADAPNTAMYADQVGLKAGAGGYANVHTVNGPGVGALIIAKKVQDGQGNVEFFVTQTHSFSNGDKVCVSATGNAADSSLLGGGNEYYTCSVINNSSFYLINQQGQTLNGAGYTAGTGLIWAGLFTSSDLNRQIAISNSGIRYWGTIVAANYAYNVGVMFSSPLPSTSTCLTWQLGSWYNSSYPATGCIHQNRLFMGGSPKFPMEVVASQSGGNFESMAASGSNYQVNDNNALQFNLSSNEVNPVYWMKSAAQGLLIGSMSAEWQIQANTQNGALTPTNFSAQQIASFGSANVDAVMYTNSAIYCQKAGRRLRELNYFFQVGTFRSTNLSELSEHLTNPYISRLAVQREVHPAIWGLRSDGQLVSLTYSRDDFSLKAGMSRHALGGQSDATGSPPVIQSLAIAQASSALYEQVWLAVSRTINASGGGGAPTASSVCTIEFMTRPFSINQTDLPEDAYYLDCGATYDNPIAVSSITNAKPPLVTTTTTHGFSGSTTVKFNGAFGLQSTFVDVNGISTTSSLINGLTFQAVVTGTTTFQLQDFVGNNIDARTYTSYLGSAVVRKMVSQITGVTWLAGDTVSVLGDGGILANTTVSITGVVGLSQPAAKVQVGYSYKSQGQMLRTKDGSAQGAAIGSYRRCNRVALMLSNVGEMSIGPSFTRLIPIEFAQADANQFNVAPALFNGIWREGLEGEATFDDTICFQQSAPLPGTIQAVVRFFEEWDV